MSETVTTHLLTWIYDDDGYPGVLFTIKHDPEVNPEEVLREAMLAWAGTPEGREAWRDSAEDFNWGDLAVCLGVFPLPDGILSIEETTLIGLPFGRGHVPVVNHDERLMHVLEED